MSIKLLVGGDVIETIIFNVRTSVRVLLG
jgi:hypothetical protein